MKKQTKVLMGIVTGLLILASAAGGLYWGLSADNLFGKKEAVNLANVEWYSEEAEEFTLTTVQELYEFAKLSQYYTFEDQIVKLGADIVINEGTASDWEKVAPKKKWVPIENFAGIFDGQGHTISGMYGKGVDINMGMFVNLKSKAILKDFKLVNSYFFATGASLGAIASNGSGNLKEIYTDAIISNDSLDGTAGFIGRVDSAGSSSIVSYITNIENCWFDGDIRMIKRDGIKVGGFVGNHTNGTLNIKNCKSSGSIDVPSPGRAPQAGGFVGDSEIANGKGAINLDGLLCDTKITSVKTTWVASYIGHVRSKCALDIKNCYVTFENFEGNSVEVDYNTHTGEVVRLSEKVLQGNGGYSWTTLDFDQYWTVVEGELPTLKSFTDKHPSLDGVKKAFNIDWYNEFERELILKTKEDFMGFFFLPWLQGVTYKGQVVKLDCDVTINEGKASEWSKSEPEFRLRPIGISRIPFQGIFDGQGHTISGVYVRETDYAGLFAIAYDESELKNLRIVNSYFEGQSFVGSLAGRSLGDVDSVYSNAIVVCKKTIGGGIVGGSLDPKNNIYKQTINNCWFDGKLEHPTDYFGYLGGIIGDNRNNIITISNCLFTGSINSQCNRWNVFMGGICGTTTNKEAVSIIDGCLSVGKLSAPMSERQNYIGSIMGNAKNNNSKIINSYASVECWEKATSYIAGFKFTNAQWPIERLKGVGGYQWTTLDFNKYWTAVPKSTPELKTFATKKQSVAGVERYLDNSWYNETKNTYVLDSRADFLYFDVVAAGNTFEGKTIKLGADIVINTGDAATWGKTAPMITWTPIGTSTYPFQGVFDGQGHSISGMYVKRDASFAAMFAIAGKDSTIKNFKLTNSYIEGVSIAASIVARGTGTLDTIYSNAYVVSESPCNGGIIGQTSTAEKEPIKVKISNCWYDGELTLKNEKWLYSGGILGDNRNTQVTITNCLYTGKISTESAMYNLYLGGIHGSTGLYGSTKYTGVTTIEGCLSTGTIKTKSKTNGSVGAILGNSVNDKTTVKNCYGTQEGYKHAIAFIAEKKSPLSSVIWPSETITGFGGYEWTNLDFDKYWAVVSNGTPILKSFAASVPEIGTRTRYIKWYNEDSKTYKLTSKEELISFSALGQSVDFKGKTILLEKDIVLNDDIANPTVQWKSVGSINKPFAGIFNGQMHTISGLYIKQNTAGVGMFSAISSTGSVRDLKLVNSYVEGTGKVGSIAGATAGNIQGIYTDATVVATSGQVIGGIVGQIDNTVKIKNSWFAGKAYANGTSFSSGARMGGIAGENSKSKQSQFVACSFTGELHVEQVLSSASDLRVGGLIGFENGTETLVDNCLSSGAINTSSTASANQYVGSIVGRGNSKTAKKPTNTYGTKETWSACTSWWGYNNPITDGQLSKALLNGEVGFIYTELSPDYWTYVKGGVPELTIFLKGEPISSNVEYKADIEWYTSTANGKEYSLSTPNQLLGFARLGQLYDFKNQTIKLAADIDLKDVPWLPVSSFKGIFDGQMKTISGLYVKENSQIVGMFSNIASGATVKNFKLIDSYIEGTGKVGSIAGCTQGNISTIYTDATVISAGQRIGGIVGQINNADVTISNCWFDGEIKADQDSGDLRTGGILGENYKSTASNITACLFSGKIVANNIPNTGTDMRIGGILGYEDTKTIPISNCLSVGTISVSSQATANQYVGSVVGRGVNKSNAKPTNTYGAKETWAACTSWWGYNNPITDGQLALADMKGATGHVSGNMILDPIYWVYVQDSTPELKSFQKGVVIDLETATQPNTDWYTSTASGATYTLDSTEELLGFMKLGATNKFTGQTIKLGKDINLYGAIWTPIKTFEGTFDGQNYTITNLMINNTSSGGMFAATASTTVIKNFRLENARVTHSRSGFNNGVGSIVANAKGGLIDTVYIDAIINTNQKCVGGIVGIATAGTTVINNCCFAGTINSSVENIAGAGGIIGTNEATLRVTNCTFNGVINIQTPSISNGITGGIIGGANCRYNWKEPTNAITEITGCLSVGTINSTTQKGCGSIVGLVLVEAAGSTINNNSSVSTWKVIGTGDTKIETANNYTATDKTQLYGAISWDNTKLSNDYFVAMPNDVPAMISFSKSKQND